MIHSYHLSHLAIRQRSTLLGLDCTKYFFIERIIQMLFAIWICGHFIRPANVVVTISRVVAAPARERDLHNLVGAHRVCFCGVAWEVVRSHDVEDVFHVEELLDVAEGGGVRVRVAYERATRGDVRAVALEPGLGLGLCKPNASYHRDCCQRHRSGEPNSPFPCKHFFFFLILW